MASRRSSSANCRFSRQGWLSRIRTVTWVRGRSRLRIPVSSTAAGGRWRASTKLRWARQFVDGQSALASLLRRSGEGLEEEPTSVYRTAVGGRPRQVALHKHRIAALSRFGFASTYIVPAAVGAMRQPREQELEKGQDSSTFSWGRRNKHTKH